MTERTIISRINEALHESTIVLADWLSKILCKVSENWWQDCVLDKLSYNQYQTTLEKNITKIEQLDLAVLLRIADRNWYAMCNIIHLSFGEREVIREMMTVRNNWAHCPGSFSTIEPVLHDISIIINFLEQRSCDRSYINDLYKLKAEIENDFELTMSVGDATNFSQETSFVMNDVIEEKSLVYIVGQPDAKGIVLSVGKVGNTKKYEVFIDSTVKTFYDGQIALVEKTPKYNWVDLSTLQSYLSAFEINNPSSGSLYSLNSARIDFVPYQFRPALKLIKADEPRILIADSVGVGKTIEAGLIIKELEARSNLEKVMIICPKPLVSERKWEIEMKRFDEEFEPLTGNMLRQIINDTERDGDWPVRYNKTIVPYSILDNRVLNGDDSGRVDSVGLAMLDPEPHFDLVIVDEAHHIRNGSDEKDKAFAYKCVKYFCDRADAVVMLTATPLQTSDDDLFTLLNVLRPDIVMDKSTFNLMSQPNAYISKCVKTIRGNKDNWQIQAYEELNGVLRTQWGENVIAEHPLFKSVLTRLEKEEITREERVQLITDVETLHSFNTMINRTRRKDIQDFCIRRTSTIESSFTESQRELHNELLRFERTALSMLHNVRSVPFMISTIRRQAASCIFGLAPHIRNIIERRFSQLSDFPEFETDSCGLDDLTGYTLGNLAKKVLELADNLPEEDPKFDGMLEIIEKKQLEENNKIIIFSTFRHTLAYIKDKLKKAGYRVEQIDGSVKDDTRYNIRNRFRLPKEDEKAFDILLFTEVGSEGLDYQFCNMMINYDLPWNPMRIEQRIGRIDRRGQISEAVNIYNLITSDTVDADIYERCLRRIGVFEKSIGECEEILGAIGNQIEQIVLDSNLTEDERRIKLEQMADNEVRKIQELSRLEDEEKELFGFDLSNKSIAKEIQDAESPWLSQTSLLSLVNVYLNARLGDGKYILGESVAKTLRLSVSAREKLLEDCQKLDGASNALRKKWERYLKGNVPIQSITFDSEYASQERNVFFITTTHPLVKQAAAYFSVNSPIYIGLNYSSDDIKTGEYAFSIYAWNYVGERSKFRLVAVAEDDNVSKTFVDILLGGSTAKVENEDFVSRWETLEEKHIDMWAEERKQYIEEVTVSANYKLNSLENNYKNRKRVLEQLIRDAFEENIIRMKKAELENATERYEVKADCVKRQVEKADIHTTLIANGVVKIQ